MIERHLKQALGVNLDSPSVRARGRRVMLLLGLVAILSIGDLAATLMFLRSTGMVELNPLAAFVIRNQSVAGLIFFKIGSVLMSVSILLMIRHTRRGEIAAWIAACILVALTVHWQRYSDGASAFASTRFIDMTQDMDEWLRLRNSTGPESVAAGEGSTVAPPHRTPPASAPASHGVQGVLADGAPHGD